LWKSSGCIDNQSGNREFVKLLLRVRETVEQQACELLRRIYSRRADSKVTGIRPC